LVATNTSAHRVERVREHVRRHPWRTVVWLLPIGIAVMLAVDAALGAGAEYFNAVHLARAWGEVLSGNSIGDAPAFLKGQSHLAAPLAVGIGTALVVAEPLIVVIAIVVPVSRVLRRSPAGDGRRSSVLEIRTEIEIAASPGAVWDQLVDLAAYEDWNPYHVRVEGKPVVAERLVVHIEKPSGDSVTIKPHVITVDPERELTWGGGLRGVFHGEHRFELSATDPGTRLVHSERFTGFAVRWAKLDSIEEGYELMNQALKTRVESDAALSSATVRAPIPESLS